MASKTLSRVADQPELALVRRPERPDIPISLVRAQRSSGAAFSLACQASGLEDKEIYMAVGLDAGYFSRIKKGEATLQGDLVATFCAVVENTVYLEWLAYQVRCTLVMIQTEAERRAAVAEARAAEAEQKLAWAMELMRGTKA